MDLGDPPESSSFQESPPAAERCEICRALKPRSEIAYVEDPYASDRYDDHTRHWICNACYHERVMDI